MLLWYHSLSLEGFKRQAAPYFENPQDAVTYSLANEYVLEGLKECSKH